MIPFLKRHINTLKNIEKTEWKLINLSNGWENLDSTGKQYPHAQYAKIGNHVFLQGLIKRTTGNNSFPIILPEGYRPSKTIKYLFCNSEDNFASAYVEKNGNVYIHRIDLNKWVDLSAISFFTSEY